MIIIDRCGLEDAESGAACQFAVWQEAYAGLVDAERLAAVDRRSRCPGGPLAFLDHRGPTDRSLRSTMTAWSASPSPDRVRRTGVDADFELFVLNVRPEYRGTGLAQQLHDRAVGNRAAFLWVLEVNPRARAFYARNGYRPDGATKIEERIFDAPIIRMVRRAPRA